MKKIIAGLLIAAVALAALPASAFTQKSARKAAAPAAVKKTKGAVHHGKKTEPPDPWGKTGVKAKPVAVGTVQHTEKTEPPDPWGKTGAAKQPAVEKK